jgi:hypothetical protein
MPIGCNYVIIIMNLPTPKDGMSATGLRQEIYIYVSLKDRKRSMSEKIDQNALWL